MSRRYQTVLTSTFDDKKIRLLDEDSRWIFIYLLICKHANLPGLFLLPMSYITRDIQYPLERVAKAFNNLIERRFIEYDQASETIFVRNWLRHKPLDNPNKVKGALAALDEIPDSPLFTILLTFVEEEKPNGYERLTEALRKRIESISKEVTVSVSVPVEVAVSEEVAVKESGNQKTVAALPTSEKPVESVENPIEPEVEPETPKKPKKEKPIKTEAQTVKSPACCAYRDVFHLWPNRTQEEKINELVVGEEDVEKWSQVCQNWALHGNKPTNVEGMLDWYQTEIPNYKPGNGKGQNSAKVASTIKTLADRIKQHQMAIHTPGSEVKTGGR